MPSFITHQPGRILRGVRHVLVLFVFARIGIPVPALAFLNGERAGCRLVAGSFPSACRDQPKDAMTANCAP